MERAPKGLGRKLLAKAQYRKSEASLKKKQEYSKTQVMGVEVLNQM